MTDEDFALISTYLTRVTFEVDEVLAVSGQPIEAVYFPEEGIITLSEQNGDGSRIGIGHTGYEGFASWSVLLGCELAPHEARMTAIGGVAYRVASDDLLAVCRASETLRTHLLKFVRCFAVQLGCTVVSSLTQSVEARLARWTLMAHDRVAGDDIEVTHNEIAVMLAVRRPSVTDALHVLEGEGLIRSQRGRVTVLDRGGLRRLARDTYGSAEAEYSRILAPFPEGRT